MKRRYLEDNALQQMQSDNRSALVPIDPQSMEEQDALDRYLAGVNRENTIVEDEDGAQVTQRLSQSQAQLQYLLATDDVPKKSKISNLWVLKSRHLQLLDVPQKQDLDKYHREIRDILRVSGWQRQMKGVSYSDTRQLEFYSGMILLPKSLQRGERTLLATQISRQENIDLANKPPKSAGGIRSTLRSLFGD